jgi:poly(3-hydroxyalkanoate) synthetase/uncharacterized tellurite resistance protein B-like protein
MFTLNPVGSSLSSLSFLSAVTEYFVDTCQRNILFWDTLRQRGNIYLDHLQAGQPPVLTFPYTIILEGTELEPPVNYSLLQILDRRAPGDHQSLSPNEQREHPELPQQQEDPAKRPILIIDPRAGHGPGIGGSKQDSQVGNALTEGHPVYFVIFYTEPIPGQTLADVHNAIAKFIEEVNSRHPQAPKPMIIGNCQAGWASSLIGAERPDISGPLVLNGAPLSFWASIDEHNPMTYQAGLWGGSWIASLLSDLGNDRFDGAHLVANFENLNPANTMWSKLYNFYSRLDTEIDRFLSFEKWWGGFFLLNSEEIHFIIENLFVGNKLEHGTLELTPGQGIDLQDIEEPVLVFSSKGDNITPPHQAMNWIKAVYGSKQELIRQKKVLVYMVHEKTGHLGIFVSQSVARKEHQQILEHIELIRYLPPGMYEMVIDESRRTQGVTDYQVRFEARSLDDLEQADCNVQQSTPFQMVAAVSQINNNIYQSYLRPWVRMWSNEFLAESLRQLHPLRLQRHLLSDLNPLLAPIQCFAPWVKDHRKPATQANPFKMLEKEFSKMIESTWEAFRKYRDSTQELAFKLIYQNPWLQNHFLGAQDEACQVHSSQTRTQEKLHSELGPDLMSKMRQGGFIEAAVRCLLAVLNADHSTNTQELKYLKDILHRHERFHNLNSDKLIQIIRDQTYLLHLDEAQALQGLKALLPAEEDRKQVLDMAHELALADTKLSGRERQCLEQVQDILNN